MEDFKERLEKVLNDWTFKLEAPHFLEIVLKALGGQVEACQEIQRSHRLIVKIGDKTLEKKEPTRIWDEKLCRLKDELLIDMIGEIYQSSPEAKLVCEKELDDWITKNETGWFVGLCGSEEPAKLKPVDEGGPRFYWNHLFRECIECNDGKLAKKHFIAGLKWIFEDLSDEAAETFAMMVGEDYGGLKYDDFHIFKYSGPCYYPLCVLADSREKVKMEMARLQEEMLREMREIKKNGA